MSHRRSVLWPDRRVKPPYGSVEIDWGHPLAQGLRVLTLPAGVPPYDLARRLPPSSNNTAKTSTFSRGAETYSDMGGVRIAWADPTSDYSDTEGAFYCRFVATAVGNGSLEILHKIGGGNQSVAAVARLVISNGSNVWGPRFYLGSYVDGFDSISIVFNTIPNNPACLYGPSAICVTWDASYLYAYLQPGVGSAVVAPTAVSRTKTIAATGEYDLTVGAATTATAGTTGFGISMFSRWSRTLTRADFTWLNADPYCFLRPIIRRSYGFVGAAAGGWKPAWAVRPSRTIGTGVI